MKKIVWILFFLLFLGVYIFRDKILEKMENIYQFLSLRLPEIQFKVPEIESQIKNFEIFLPPPLRVEKEEKGFLTKEGVIKWTNLQREKYGLRALKENQILNQSAKLKLNDMFENQYFAHVSPTGIELKDLAKKVGYDYILIGENLAMGNFKDDQDLVLSWMESEGHRENILNKNYQEIGVAVGEGILEGKKIWIAVQHFGKPLASCPQPNKELKLTVDQKLQILEDLEKKLRHLKTEIEFGKFLSFQEKKELIENYNKLVKEYNLLYEDLQNLIAKYNEQVKTFNECVRQ